MEAHGKSSDEHIGCMEAYGKSSDEHISVAWKLTGSCRHINMLDNSISEVTRRNPASDESRMKLSIMYKSAYRSIVRNFHMTIE
jgi:hypothetical protein